MVELSPVMRQENIDMGAIGKHVNVGGCSPQLG